MLDNYEELMELWDWSLENCTDSAMKARIRGVQSYMNTYSFLFGCQLAVKVLSITDNLSASLQVRV